MSKHYFKESKALGDSPEFYRIVYCEWCGIVVWDFNNTKQALQELQKNAQTSCKANEAEDE